MSDVATTYPGSMLAHTIHSGSGSAGAAAGAGMGIGGLALGGLGGLLVGAMLNNGNGGLFGNNRNDCAGPAVALGALEFMEQAGDIKTAIVSSAGATETAIAASNLATLQATNQLASTMQATGTQSLIQSLNSFAQQNAVLSAGFGENYRAQQESANDIKAAITASAAQQSAIAAAQALALQQCCCEMQKQSLENTQKILDQNSGFRLQDLQIDNSNLRQTLALRDNNDAQTRIILSHLVPSCGVVRTA